MRIVHFSPSYWPIIGGAERHAEMTSRALAARGHEVHVVTVNHVEPLGVNSRPRLAPPRERRAGVEVHRIPHSGAAFATLPWMYRLPVPGRANARRALRGAAYRRLGRTALATIRELRPDVVMTIGQLRSVDAVIQAGERGEFPVVVVPLIHIEDTTSRWYEITPRLLAATHVITNTAYEAAHCRKSGVPPDQVSTCPLAAPVPDEAPAPHPRPPRVLYLGRKTPKKGLLELMAAMRAVWTHRPDAILTLAGARVRGSDEIDAAVAALPAELRGRVESLYDIDEAEKTRVLQQSACLVLPSVSESFGLVLVEAWMHGTPVVTYDMDVFRCTVTPEEDGLLTPPKDIDAMAGAIRRLLDDAALAERLGRAGHAKAKAAHTWDAVGARYEAVYERAIARHATRLPVA